MCVCMYVCMHCVFTFCCYRSDHWTKKRRANKLQPFLHLQFSKKTQNCADSSPTHNNNAALFNNCSLLSRNSSQLHSNSILNCENLQCTAKNTYVAFAKRQSSASQLSTCLTVCF